MIVEYHRFIVKNIEIMWYTTYLSIRINCEKIFLASEIKDERSILGNIEEGINKLTYSVILIYPHSKYYKFNLWLLDPTQVNTIEIINLVEKRYGD